MRIESRHAAGPARVPPARYVEEPSATMKPELFDIPFIYYGVKGYGFMLMIGFLTGIWWATRLAAKVKADPDMILNVGFIALIFGVIGARMFYVIHYWHRTFAGRPWSEIVNVTAGGLEFYGGFVAAMVFIILYVVSHGHPTMARLLAMFWIALTAATALLVHRALAPSGLRAAVAAVILVGVCGFIGKGLWQWSTRAGRGSPASLRLYLDIMTPSLMWGLAFGRVGCFLNGCCWGAVCEKHSLPWVVQFPCGSPSQYDEWLRCESTLPAALIYIDPRGVGYPIPRDLLTLKEEKRLLADNNYRKEEDKLRKLEQSNAGADTIEAARGRLKRARSLRDEMRTAQLPLLENMRQFNLRSSDIEKLAQRPENRSRPLHPAQLYSAVNAMLLAFLLNAAFYRRKRHGVVFGLMWALYPIARIVEEAIRADNPLDTGGMTASQAVSVAGLAFAAVWFWALSKMPLRSPSAVPFVPPTGDKEGERTAKR